MKLLCKMLCPEFAIYVTLGKNENLVGVNSEEGE